MSIAENLRNIIESIPDDVTLVAVSKTKPIEDIMKAYEAGQRIFGENKVQEMVAKHEQLPKDIQWHMIGHVQRNKVKYMAGFVNLIHGVDNLRLLQEINKQAQKHQRTIHCLLQIKIAREDSKFGMDQKEINDFLTSEEFSVLQNIKIVGFMGMATFTNDLNIIESEFRSLKGAFDEFKTIKTDNCEMDTISMGMSGDYQTAIKCGSNMIRVGSSIFGERVYSN